MDDLALEAKKLFELELNQALKHREVYTSLDFRLAHTLLWISVAASFASAIIIASSEEVLNNFWMAVIAGTPGLVVVIDRTFDFTRRSVWGVMYTIDLKELRNDYTFGKIDAHTAAQRLQKIIRDHENAFLKIGFYSRDREDYKKGDEKIE